MAKQLKRIQNSESRLSTDKLLGKEYPTNCGGVLTVIGDNGLTGNKKKLKLECGLCSQDKEMYPDFFYSTKVNLDNGQIPCGCSNSMRRTNEQIILTIKRKIEDSPYKLKEIIKLSGSSTRFIYTCPDHGDTEVSYNNFVNHGHYCKDCGKVRFIDTVVNRRIDNIKELCHQRGYTFVRYTHESKMVTFYCETHNRNHRCLYDNFIYRNTDCPECSILSNIDKQRLPYDLFLERTKTRCYEGGFIFNRVVGDYIGSSSTISFSCPEHGEKFATYRNFVSNGTGCNECMQSGFNVRKPGYFYISKWVLGDVVIGKYGITNRTPEIRMEEQSRGTGFIPVEINSIFFENGQNALDLENFVSGKWNHGILTEKEFSDGFTETVCESDYMEINNSVDSLKL